MIWIYYVQRELYFIYFSNFISQQMFVYLALEAALQKYWFTSLLLPKQVWK